MRDFRPFLLCHIALVCCASAASNDTTTSPVSTDPPPAPQSDGPDVRAIRFALLGTAIGLVGCGACVLLACWVHKNRTVPGTERRVPTADTLDEERALQKAKREQQAKDDQMRFGPGTKVRGQHLVELKEHWDEKHRQTAERKHQDAHDNRPVNAYGEYLESDTGEAGDAAGDVDGGERAVAASARTRAPHDASSAASPVNPIDRFRNADAVASYRTNPGPHAMPWEGEPRVGADGMPIQLIEASDVDSPDRWPVGTEFSRRSNAVSAPANTQFTAPGATSPTQQPDDAPFVLKMSAAAKAAHEADVGGGEDDGDVDAGDDRDAAKKRRDHRSAKKAKPPQGLLAHVRSFFINDPEIDSAVDARFVRPEPNEVFNGLARRDEALAGTGTRGGVQQQQQRNSRLQQQVDQHEMTETAYADATGVADLCAEWLEDLEPPKIDKRVAMRNVANWCGDLPPEPAGAEAQQGFASDRTGRWVEGQRPGPYELPPQSRSVYTPPAVTPPNATTPRTPGVRSTGHTPRRESGAGDPLEKPQAHIPMALRLTSDSLRLPPKRDSLGRLMAP